MSEVLATVGVPPVIETAPPLTRISPAALRLTTMELFRASPRTVNVPAEKVAVTAGNTRSPSLSKVSKHRLFAGWLPTDRVFWFRKLVNHDRDMRNLQSLATVAVAVAAIIPVYVQHRPLGLPMLSGANRTLFACRGCPKK